MGSIRNSYRKTVFLAAGGALAGSFALAVSIQAGRLASGTWWAPRHLGWHVLVVALAGVLGVVLAVLAGGLIALQRDTLQVRGVPYALRAPREWRPSATIRMSRRVARTVRALPHSRSSPERLKLRPGDPIEIRSLNEILATLDERGTFDSLPFMPEMAALCGRQARVFRVVHRIHDYVGRTGLRRMRDTVLLEGLRCDGSAHGGCQASCHLLWKEAWLKRSHGAGLSAKPASDSPQSASELAPLGSAAEPLLRLSRRVGDDGASRFVCQMTQVAEGTSPLAWADPRHYLRDLLTGNVRPGPFLSGVSIALFNWAQRRRGGAVFPGRPENPRKTSPHETLDLQPGERVTVKTLAEIEATLNADSRNRGLWFDPDMIRYCGGEYRVHSRVERIVDERTGKLLTLSIPSIILEGVTATGEYLAFCPQNDAIFWREIWLQRVPETLHHSA